MQLEATTQSKWAQKLGFKTSFMEYLLTKECYRMNKITRKYNTKHIEQLTKNYRNHPAILEIANEMFYDNTLEAKSPQGLHHSIHFLKHILYFEFKI